MQNLKNNEHPTKSTDSNKKKSGVEWNPTQNPRSTRQYTGCDNHAVYSFAIAETNLH